MAWTVEFTSEFAAWARELRKLDRETAKQVGVAVELLKEHRPYLKRRVVHANAGSTVKQTTESLTATSRSRWVSAWGGYRRSSAARWSAWRCSGVTRTPSADGSAW